MDSLYVYEKLTKLLVEIGGRSWSGLAWACLRRNPRYRRALRRVEMGLVGKAALRAEYGIAEPKSHEETFSQGEAPKFAAVRIVRSLKGKTIHPSISAKTTKVILRPTQVCIAISLEHSLEKQWQAVLPTLREQIATGLEQSDFEAAPQNLKQFSAMAKLVITALTAYELATDEEWKLQRIGNAMAEEKPEDRRRGYARELVERGRGYVERGYLTFALEAEIQAQMVTTSQLVARPRDVNADEQHQASLGPNL